MMTKWEWSADDSRTAYGTPRARSRMAHSLCKVGVVRLVTVARGQLELNRRYTRAGAGGRRPRVAVRAPPAPYEPLFSWGLALP